MYKLQKKFQIKESCGGSYVVIFFYERIPSISLLTTINGFEIEQWYDIPNKREIAFRLKNVEDFDKIGDDVILNHISYEDNEHFNSEGFSF